MVPGKVSERPCRENRVNAGLKLVWPEGTASTKALRWVGAGWVEARLSRTSEVSCYGLNCVSSKFLC